MAKRGSSGLSLVLGIDKPVGMSSHDVVNRVRRLLGERRVGHTGTLDPLASGVLVVCVGPAARLDAYLTGHDKTYRVRVVFGTATSTDDAEGEAIKSAPVSSELYDDLSRGRKSPRSSARASSFRRSIRPSKWTARKRMPLRAPARSSN